MMRPTPVEPVKLTARTRSSAISASATSAASSGALVTTLSTPSGRPASRSTSATKSPQAIGASSLGLTHDGVARGERRGDGADAEDDRGVPRRERRDDADGFADREAERALRLGAEHLTARGGDRGRGLAQHVRREATLNMRPGPGAADLARPSSVGVRRPGTPAGRPP